MIPDVMPLAPAVTDDSAPFWAAAGSGDFRLQQCGQCGQRHWPAADVCPRCWGQEPAWKHSSGLGRVSSWVVFRKQYFEEFPPPYVVATIELDDGPRFVALMDVAPENITEGMRARIEFRPLRAGTAASGPATPTAVPVFVCDDQ